MKIELAKSYGFCFGVKRAIKIAEEHQNSSTMGPLIHNQDEINRLKNDFNVGLYNNLSDVKNNDTVIIRTHGIPKNELKDLRKLNPDIDYNIYKSTTNVNLDCVLGYKDENGKHSFLEWYDEK